MPADGVASEHADGERSHPVRTHHVDGPGTRPADRRATPSGRGEVVLSGRALSDVETIPMKTLPHVRLEIELTKRMAFGFDGFSGVFWKKIRDAKNAAISREN